MSDSLLISKNSARSTGRSKVSLLWLVLIAYLILLAGALFVAFSHWGYDDPFITYRYAENIRQGRGFVYNPGEKVLSTTTPFFALLLAALSTPRVPTPQLAIIISSISLAAGGLFLWDLGRSWKLPWVGWAGLLLYPTFPLVLSTTGSETPLYLALCLGAFATYTRRWLSLAAVFSALAILTRPDGVLVPAILAAHYSLHRLGSIRKEVLVDDGSSLNRGRFRLFISGLPWNSILLFVGMTVPWFIFSFVYFGSLVPVTLTAKQAQGEMAISQRFLPGMFTIMSWYSSWPYKLEAVLGLVGLSLLPKSARPATLLLTWTVVYFAAYSALGVSRYFWYYAPLVPGFLLLAGLGVSVIGKDWLKKSSRASTLTVILAAGFLVLLLFGQVGTLLRMRANSDNRLSIYRETGEWLAANTVPGATVGALEVGIIGYYARRPMIDFAGLIQPPVARQFEANTTYEDSALWALEEYKPGYVVLQEGLFPSVEQGYISQYCLPVKTISNEGHRYPYSMVIYSCQ